MEESIILLKVFFYSFATIFMLSDIISNLKGKEEIGNERVILWIIFLGGFISGL